MYPPKHHQEYHTDTIKQVAMHYPFATLVSAKENTPFITHAPLIVDGNKLIGHIDKSNPHINLLKKNHPVTAIFQGPQTYISPSIYDSKNQLPTWNYVIAHAKGLVKEITDITRIKQSMVVMTEFLETPNHNYILKLSNEKMDRFVNYVHAFEIEIASWEGKFKLSQDKTPIDIENAKQALIQNNQKNVAGFVNKLFKKSF